MGSGCSMSSSPITSAIRREVIVGIETDRGLWVTALVAAGYQVYAINPLAASQVSGPPQRRRREVRCG